MIDILLLIIFMILAISIGAYFFDFYKLEFSSRMEFLLFSLAIGLGIISYTIFFLAVMGILYSWTIYIFLILLLLFSIPKIYRSTRQFRYKSLKVTHQPFINYLLFFIIGTYIGLTFIDALVPPTEADSLVYHLADPKKFLKYHSLIHTQIPGIDLKTSKIMPFNFEMLYVIPLTFDRDIFAKLIQFGTALCAGLVLYMLSARFFSKLAGLFAVAVFLIQPFVFNYVSTPKVDTAIVLYAILSLYTFLVWYDNQESKWLILCGIFSGLFFACKLSGLFLMIILSVLIFYKLFYEKKFDFKYSGFYLIKYLVPAFIITAPWLLRSWVVIGDPLYPYIIKLTGDHFKTNLIHHKKSVIDFITYPWNLTLDPGQLMRRGSIYKEKISPLFLAIIPGLLLLKTCDRKIKYLLLFGVISVYIIYPFHIRMRYCIGGIAALSVVVGYVIDQFYLSRRNVFLKNIIMVFLCMPFIVNLYQLCRVNVPKINVALKRVSRDDYLEKQYRDLFLMEKYVNKELPEDAVIFAPWENSSYRFDKQFLTGNHIVKAMLEIRSPGEWVNVLKGTYKVDYLLLNRNYHEILIKRYENGSLGYDPCNNILFSKKMKKYLKHVYSSGKCSLYKLP